MYRYESWTIKKGEELMFLNCGVGELEIPSDCKEIKPVNPQGNQSWKITGRTDAEAKVPIHWPPDAKSWLLRKDPDVGKDWRQEEKGMTEDEMVGWHHRLNRHEFEQAPGVGGRQGGLVCCSSWGRKESDMTERLNWYWYWFLVFLKEPPYHLRKVQCLLNHLVSDQNSLSSLDTDMQCSKLNSQLP